MLNLGLGVLVKKEESVQVLSYEYLDTVMMYNEACEELTIVCDQFDQICTAYENLISINDVIKEHGVTPALEALVGENFPGGLTAAASMEAAEGAMGKIKEFLVKVWEAIKNFFIRFFSFAEGKVTRLKEWIAAADKAAEKDFTGHEFTGFNKQTIENGLPTYASKLSGLTKESTIIDASFTGNFKMEAITLNFADAKKYATSLKDNLSKMLAAKSQVLSLVDAEKKAAESVENDEERKKKVEDAKNVKAFINAVIKGCTTSAAAFLSHNTIGKAKSDDKKEEPAANDPKKDDAKPAENAEAGKADEGK